MTPSPDLIRFTARLSAPSHEELSRLSDEADVSLNRVLQRAVDQYIATSERTRVSTAMTRRIWDGLTFPMLLKAAGADVEEVDPNGDPEDLPPGWITTRLGGFLGRSDTAQWATAGFHVVDDESLGLEHLVGLATASLNQHVLRIVDRVKFFAGRVIDGDSRDLRVRYGGITTKEWVQQDGWMQHLQGRLSVSVSAPIADQEHADREIANAEWAARELAGQTVRAEPMPT